MYISFSSGQEMGVGKSGNGSFDDYYVLLGVGSILFVLIGTIIIFISATRVEKKVDKPNVFLANRGISYKDAVNYCHAMNIDMDVFINSKPLQEMYKRHGNKVVIVRKNEIQQIK